MAKPVKFKEFLEWVKDPSNEEDVEAFFEEANLAQEIALLEQDDFFGTEGFNKRFA